MSERKHTLLVVPGLGETTARRHFFMRSTEPLQRRGLSPKFFSAHWDNEHSFPDKLDIVDDLVAKELKENNRVSLLGASAAGPLVVGALMERPEIHRVVTLSSRLKSTEYDGYPNMDFVEGLSPAAAEGVRWLEEHLEASLTAEMRGRILNTRAIAGDQQVHPSTSFIAGAENVWMPPSRNHIEAVSKALTEHSEVIVDFLTTD